MTIAQLQCGVSAAFHEGSPVWVPVVETVNRATADGSNKRRVTHWRRAVVQAVHKDPADDSLLDVTTEDGLELEALPAADCYLQNERDDTVDDLVKSDFLHEPGILHTLRVRYCLDSIYTYSGNILIAANPHKRLRQLYGPRMMSQYRGVPLGQLSPHVYAIAEQAFSAMMVDEARQAILVSGESGAGKTESAKMVMQYLAHRAMPTHGQHAHVLGGAALARTGSNGQGAAAAGGHGVESAPIEEQVLESNPLLEAFGNAKTSRNDNSSRFGKFVEIDFDAGGRVTGASISTYLLERSRVVSIKAPERSYHIFYQLCAGASEAQRAELGLGQGAAAFRYLNQSSVYTLTDVDDAQEFRHTLEAMHIVGLQQSHVDAVLRTVAGVLHLGNVEFDLSSRDEAVVAGAGSMAALETAARLLGVSDLGLEAALTTRAIETRGERIVKRLDAAAAVESRDALAKTLYARLFDWLVAAINKKINSLGSGASGSGAKEQRRSIGILDIYGFESFDSNSFEQLCINLANERLQQQFNAHGEQEEYAREGIAWSYIDFIDNQDCLDLLEGGAGSLGVFPLIDEACRLPRATYKDLAHTLRTRLAGQPRFGAPRRQQHAFVVDHYAGEVCYSAERLMDKNKDFVVAEHAHLLGSSGVAIIRELFAADAAAAATGGAAADSISASAGSELPSPKRPDVKGRRSAFMLSSVGARFRKQLGGLMGTLSQCQPHFIRCVKPNPDSQPGSLAPEYVLEQLRAGGVLEAVRIATAGFPTRKPVLPFAQRYALLLPEGQTQDGGALPLTPSGFIDWFAMPDAQVADVARRILFASQLDGWQLGKTRVFLRAGQLAQLEGSRGRRLSAAALQVQAAWRGKRARRLLRRARSAAVTIQSGWRGHKGRLAAQQLRRERAAVRLQAAWRMHHQRAAYQLQRRTRAATAIQSYVRMHQQRRRFVRDTELGKKQAARAAHEASRVAAATAIQAAARGRLARKKARPAAAGGPALPPANSAQQLRREAAQLRELQQQRDSLLAAREQLGAALAAAAQRADRAEAEVASLRAQVASLSSEVEAAQVQLRASQAAAAEAASAATASAATAAQAAVAAELQAAHAKVEAALQQEIEVLRQQRSAGSEQRQQLEAQVHELQQAAVSGREAAEAAAEAARQREVQTAELLREAQAAAEEQRSEVAAKDAALAALSAESAVAAAGQREEVAALRSQLQREVAALQAQLEAQAAAAADEEGGRAAALKEAQEMGTHLSARVLALTSRTQRLEEDVRAAAAREAALQEELAAAKRAAVALQRSPSKIGALTPAASRTLSENFEAAGIAAVAGLTPGGPVLTEQREAAVEALVAAAVHRRLQMVAVPLGGSGLALSIPLSAWLLCESLIRWAGSWKQAEIDAAADCLQRAIVDAAYQGGLQSQAYWLACSLAAGGLLKFRTIGRKEGGHLLRLGDTLINCQPVHEALGDSVADVLVVDVAVLLSEDAKRVARRRGHTPPPHESPNREAQSPWRALLGGVSNVLDALRVQGVPAPAVRAVAWACLRFIDGELLNALLLRRDCCSVSAAKALQAGLAELRGWAAYVGGEWCCGAEEAEGALERVTQAARYLVQGKEDCVRKACRGVDIVADLARSCPALSLQQVYKLTEHQHDDWIVAASSGRESIALLEMLRRLMAEQRARAGAPNGGARLGGYDEEDEEDLLVEPREAFVLPWKVLTEAARCFVQPPAATAAAAAGTPARPAACPSPAGTPATPASGVGSSPLRAHALSGAPRLPNGSLPASAAAASPAPALSSLSLLDSISKACLEAELPGELLQGPEFAFLAPEAPPN